MYKIYRFILLGLCVSGMSCSKSFLEQTPKDFISPENFLTSDEQALLLVNGAYRCLDFTGATNENQKMFPLHLETMTDNAYDSQPWHNTTEWARGQGNANSPWAFWKWDLNWKGISRANVFIDGIARVDFDSPNVSRYVAEVKFLRAWFYHDLLTFYGDVPLILNPGELSNSFPHRTPRNEVLNQILQDLDEAIPSLPWTYETDSDRGRVTKGAAMGLKARVLLFEQRWEEAAEAAKDIIDAGVYTLYPNYQELFLEDSEGKEEEIMLQIYFTADIMPSHIYYPIGVYPAFAPTLQLVNSYYMKNGLPITDPQSGYDPENPFLNRDPRFEASIFYPGSQYVNYIINAPNPNVSTDSIEIPLWLLAESGFRCKKHFNGKLENVEKEGRNKFLMRYAEMLLTYAEATNEAFGPAGAYEPIDALRDRVGMTKLSQAMPNLSKEQMREVIRNERRIELVFEGTRLADIRRWRIGEEVMVDALGLDYSLLNEFPGVGAGTNEDWQYEPVVIDSRSFNPIRDYLWPIPQIEIDANPNMVQNPGYN